MSFDISTPTTGTGAGIGGSDYALSHEVTAGTKVLVFGVNALYVSGNGATSAKWDTTAMSVAANKNDSSFCAAIFYLVNPKVGTFNVIAHDDNNAGAAGNSPKLFAVNLSGEVGTADPVGDLHTGSEDQTFIVEGTLGAIFDTFMGDTIADVDVASTIIYANATIGIADRASASYRTHSGSNITVNHTADLDFYAGAEFKNGNDLVTLQMISL